MNERCQNSLLYLVVTVVGHQKVKVKKKLNINWSWRLIINDAVVDHSSDGFEKQTVTSLDFDNILDQFAAANKKTDIEHTVLYYYYYICNNNNQ